MFLPYASDSPPTRRPTATLFLISLLILVALYVEWLHSHHTADTFLYAYGIYPAQPRPLSFFTYLFVHDGLDRLFVNLCYLWVFGSGVEEAVGRKKFLLLFVLGGVLGGLLEWGAVTTILPVASRTLPITGASAACAGIMGVFAVHYYRARLSFAFPPMRPHVATVVTVFLAYEMLTAIIELVMKADRGGVAHWAHVGGFLAGLLASRLLRLGNTGERAYLVQDAHRAMSKSDPGVAIERWQSLLASEPENVTAMKELAKAWNLFGDPEHTTEYSVLALKTLLKRNERAEATQFYLEMRPVLEERSAEERDRLFTPAERFQIGNGLEEREAFAAAAEMLRNLTVRHPDAPEVEVALLKVITIYSRHLQRTGEANILGRMFLERYPRSQWRNMAEEMMQEPSGGNLAP